ncbi:uncharacterized protein J4E88_008264 [Alternaria novae-zelandiae]|uniref:uncharacterized protein n=1 Tax=Alternaria novae-zelandiae TaxID=430562 RepID=UPI0020C33F81|nr:uncharacterized protein J4E88_008264 [Alternaria novae-zelandiae]KAI4674528.1 hypothetical protein J4E88_008264 [Alternaria novae-zelandiae]
MMTTGAQSSPSRGGWSSLEEELAYYKSQYETLEMELQEFQASSKELEAELERDVEESEKRERKLQEKAEKLGFEVEEWKTKYKQSKAEANNAQNTLQKEITTMRESQRALQMRLRDIEVQSDDFERQARHQTSSLEDVESKYNVAIERSVMLEEEIKIGEQEREALRIETQRLRDELSDLRVEAEITQEKLRIAEETIENHHVRKVSNHLSGDALRPRSPVSEASTTATTVSSPTAASTPPHSKADGLHTDATPPSPPLSDAPITTRYLPSTPMPKRKNSYAPLDPGATPRAGLYQRVPRHSRGPTPASRAPRPSFGSAAPPPSLPRSGSLVQVRGLIGKMQKLEERVHAARSKLPAPTTTPPRASPRNGSAMGHHVPSTVTLRSGRKRSSHASAGSSVPGAYESGQQTSQPSIHVVAVSNTAAGKQKQHPNATRTLFVFVHQRNGAPDAKAKELYERSWPFAFAVNVAAGHRRQQRRKRRLDTNGQATYTGEDRHTYTKRYTKASKCRTQGKQQHGQRRHGSSCSATKDVDAGGGRIILGGNGALVGS